MAGFPVIGSGKFIASDILLLMQGVQVLNHSERSEGLGFVILSEYEGSGFKALRTNQILRANETSPQDDRSGCRPEQREGPGFKTLRTNQILRAMEQPSV